MSSTIVIVLNKGTSLVVWQGLDLLLPVRWHLLHRGKLAILSAVMRHTYLKDCLKEDVTVSGEVFSLVSLMAVEHSQYRTASFSAKVTSWWHSCPGSYWAYWQCVRPKQQYRYLTVRAFQLQDERHMWSRKWFQESFVTKYCYNQQYQLFYCMGRTDIWILLLTSTPKKVRDLLSTL